MPKNPASKQITIIRLLCKKFDNKILEMYCNKYISNPISYRFDQIKANQIGYMAQYDIANCAPSVINHIQKMT